MEITLEFQSFASFSGPVAVAQLPRVYSVNCIHLKQLTDSAM